METISYTRALESDEVPHWRSPDFDPAPYRLLGEYYCGPSEDMQDAYASDVRAIEEQIGDLWWDLYLGKCACCGAIHSYGAVYVDTRNGGVFVVGHTCAGNAFRFTSQTDHLRSRVLAERQRVVERLQWALDGALRGEQFLAERPQLAADLSLAHGHRILDDLRSKLFRWGSLSDKQIEFAAKLAEEVRTPAPDTRPSIPVPDDGERRTVEGIVFSVKWQEDRFAYGGESQKMGVTVETDDGDYRIWGSVPSALYRVERGDRVRFAAKLQRSDKDESFGFFKRPTKPTYVGRPAFWASHVQEWGCDPDIPVIEA